MVSLLACARALSAAPAVSTPSVSPSSLVINQATLVTASCKITTSPGDPALMAGGVNLVRLTSSGADVSVLGQMHDDGLSGDATAGDGIYSLQFTTTESITGQFQLQCSVAFAKTVSRVRSTPVAVAVLATGSTHTISSLTLTPNSIPLATATSVTATASINDSALVAGSVILQRLNSSGLVIATVGTMHDDGVNGDAVANDGVFTVQSSFNEFAVGAIPLEVTASFTGATSHSFSSVQTLNVTGTPPPTVSFSLPANLSFLNLSPTTVNGTVSDPAATVVINSITATVAPNGSFSAQVPLAEGPNIVTAAATSAGGSAGTSSITVTLDTTPPHVTITSPPDQFVTTDASISVAGNVNDIVVGTVNSQQATVRINNTDAAVANRTFLSTSVPLNLGANTISAVGTDRAGNSATTQITVTRQVPAPGQISLVSGNNQTAAIGAALTAPLVVSLTDSTGAPAANKSVIFSVTQNNGMLSVAGGTPAATVNATTDAQGHTQVVWTLGQRSGAGGNAVQAYSVGSNGTALFTLRRGRRVRRG